MRISIFLFSLLLPLLSFGESISFNQLVGKYEVTSTSPITQLGDGVSVKYDLTINENETINLVERVVQSIEDSKEVELMKMECAGTVSIDSTETIVSSVTCTHGESYIQRIDLSKIENFNSDNFTAPVFSSLYGVSIEMNFEKK